MTIPPLDPVEATIRAVRARGVDAVDEAAVTLAWWRVLLPELERRVGTRIGSLLTDRELEEVRTIPPGEQLTRWLSATLPAYRELVEEETDQLVWLAVSWYLVGAGRADQVDAP